MTKRKGTPITQIHPQANITGQQNQKLPDPMCPFCRTKEPGVAWQMVGETGGSFVYILMCKHCGCILSSMAETKPEPLYKLLVAAVKAVIVKHKKGLWKPGDPLN